ncbi:MAG: hypothetical protein ACK4OJ_00290 [Brevundimonas sp.]
MQKLTSTDLAFPLMMSLGVTLPRYRLLLHDGPTTTPESRDLDVKSDGDAQDLAQITLLGTSDFTHVQLWKDEEMVEEYQRDGHSSLG